jgi:phosphoenolpyruvate carboxylase
LLRIGSWIGGDRDGNPFVTADVLVDTFQQQASLALVITSASCGGWLTSCRCRRG